MERPQIYNKKSQVTDIEVARQGAQVENKYRKKLFGLFNRSKEHIAEGEQKAEIAMEQTVDVELDSLPSVVKSEYAKFVDFYKDPENKSFKFKNELGQDIKGDLILENMATVGDLGDGVLRYRLSCELDEGRRTRIVGGVPIRKSEYDFLVVVIDVKDNSVIDSKVIPRYF